MTRKQLKSELKKLSFECTYDDSNGIICAEGPLLSIRVTGNEIEIGERKTFDRWGNSTNFTFHKWDEYPKNRVKQVIKMAPKDLPFKDFQLQQLFSSNRFDMI